jgi:transposase-like protein
MPKKFPAEFKRDVVAVARRGQLSQAEIASDFGTSETTLRRWLKQADIDDGKAEGVTSAEQDELVQLRRRARLLEQEKRSCVERRPTSPRTRSQMTYPLVRDLAAEEVPVTVACGVLGFSTQAYNAWCGQPVSQREWDDAHLVDAIIDIHDDDSTVHGHSTGTRSATPAGGQPTRPRQKAATASTGSADLFGAGRMENLRSLSRRRSRAGRCRSPRLDGIAGGLGDDLAVAYRKGVDAVTDLGLGGRCGPVQEPDLAVRQHGRVVE